MSRIIAATGGAARAIVALDVTPKRGDDLGHRHGQLVGRRADAAVGDPLADQPLVRPLAVG